MTIKSKCISTRSKSNIYVKYLLFFWYYWFQSMFIVDYVRDYKTHPIISITTKVKGCELRIGNEPIVASQLN